MEILRPTISPGEQGIRVVAPSRSIAILGDETINSAENNLRTLGFNVSYGLNVNERDSQDTSSVESRISDINDALRDEDVDILLAAIGGYSTNQLLPFIDWDIFRKNPKVFCGYSDLTILCNSIFQMSGVVTYYGPNFSSFAKPESLGETGRKFRSTIEGESEEITSDDSDEKGQIVVVNEGYANGILIGGNLNSFNLLQGTEYFPNVENPVFLIEDDYLTDKGTFDRDLESLIQSKGFRNARGLIFGKFPKETGVTTDSIKAVINRHGKLSTIPIVSCVDFGHTNPKRTIPIGGNVSMRLGRNSIIQIQY